MKGINYAWSVSAVNRDDLTAFEKWLKQSKGKIKDKLIYIWGAGIRGTEFGIFLKRSGINGFFFVDNNPDKQGGHIDGALIVSPDEAIKHVRDNKAVILISTELDIGIKEQLQKEGMVFEQDFFTASNLEYEHYVDEFIRESSVSYIIMGDCMFSGISLYDENNANLSDMIKSDLGVDRCKVLYMHGMGIRSYYNIFRMYCLNKGFPKSLEIMVNFETLTGRQHLLPRSQHNVLFHMLDEVLDIKDDEWTEYLGVVDERAENNQIEMSHRSNKLTLEQERDMKNRNYLRMNYMYKLDTQTEGLVYFRKLVDFAKQNGVDIVPFIPPVNYELGIRYFGDRFEDMYNENMGKIKEIVDGLGLTLEDYSHIFTPEYFAETDTTDESLNEHGRKRIKERLIERL